MAPPSNDVPEKETLANLSALVLSGVELEYLMPVDFVRRMRRLTSSGRVVACDVPSTGWRRFYWQEPDGNVYTAPEKSGWSLFKMCLVADAK